MEDNDKDFMTYGGFYTPAAALEKKKSSPATAPAPQKAPEKKEFSQQLVREHIVSVAPHIITEKAPEPEPQDSGAQEIPQRKETPGADAFRQKLQEQFRREKKIQLMRQVLEQSEALDDNPETDEKPSVTARTETKPEPESVADFEPETERVQEEVPDETAQEAMPVTETEPEPVPLAASEPEHAPMAESSESAFWEQQERPKPAPESAHEEAPSGQTEEISLDTFMDEPKADAAGTEEVSLDDFISADEFGGIEVQDDTKAARKGRKKKRRRSQAKKRPEKKAVPPEQKVRHPIGIKLILIISAIVVIAMGGVTYLVSYFVTNDIRMNALENNLAINSRTASDTENRINSLVSSAGMFLDLLASAGENETEIKSVENIFFDRNKTVAAVYVSETGRTFTNTTFFISHELDAQYAADYFAQETEAVEKAYNGGVELQNASMFFNNPMLSIFYAVPNGYSYTVVGILYSTEELSESFSSGSVNLSYFVNNDGIILVHSDVSYIMNAADVSDYAIVQSMLGNPSDNAQTTYRDENGEENIGAFRKLSIGNGAVITTVKTSVILEGVRRTTVRNIYITIALLAIVIMIIYFFAKSLSEPLKQLTSIVNEINNGNFNTELFADLKTKRSDEIGILARSTKNEREILNTFTKLTNKGVTKAIITKTIDFEPHLKDITIFFSDIRGFTAISDGFEKRFGEQSAGEIITFLNDYMSRMVTCVSKTGGIIDKFEGDAIMAVWGALRNDSLDWELQEGTEEYKQRKLVHDDYVKTDALNAITACLAMRYSLMKYNKDAEQFSREHENEPQAQYKPHIKIGAGINSGRATVGFMGSYEKMEFTSIGDAVNFASRTEASNKPCGTDILITQDTYDILKTDYIRCKENGFTIKPMNVPNEIIVEEIPVDFEVKGKGKQHFYGVVNMPHFDIQDFFGEDLMFEVDPDCEVAAGPKGPKTLSEMRRILGIEEPDFTKVNLDAEENKVQVASP